jgi:hypothetical protein
LPQAHLDKELSATGVLLLTDTALITVPRPAHREPGVPTPPHLG